ncbi:hypothetical protein ACFOY2_05250 [Nonomuraea purpurea]|uniref:Uncharacterized protein n=1 Tax=Nonomuraea purpurea TaxID=1849276 RepID=A0ABV8FY30_9ACTN
MREEYDPDRHGSYGAWLRSKNLQTRAGGWTNATHDQVLTDTKHEKRVLDQLGNEVRQYGRDQQDVTINSPQTVVATIQKEGSRVEP